MNLFGKIEQADQLKVDQVFAKFESRFGAKRDPWGLSLEKAKGKLEFALPLYHDYFKVRTFGMDKIQGDQFMVVSNHTGQIAIDGMLITTAMAWELDQPLLLRPMVERFFTSLPFVGAWSAEGGTVLGDRQNCLHLLKRGHSVLVFPEGVRGIAKNTSNFYQLQSFTRGFYRLALAAGVPILPVATVGCEEFYPLVYHPKPIARLLNLPAMPLTPNLIPLPSPVDLHFLEPIVPPIDLSPEAPDKEIDVKVREIEDKIRKVLGEGMKKRRAHWSQKISGIFK